MSIKISKLEEELKLKTLECIEKDGTIEEMQTDNLILKEEALAKDALNEANLGKLNELEENLKKSVNRVNLVEHWANKMMHENEHLKKLKNVNAAVENNHDDTADLRKLKLEVKSKNKEIKLLNDQKNILANELRDMQEKANGGQNRDVTEKCLKLTADVGRKNNEIKAL